MDKNCLEFKITSANNKLKPIILQAIKDIYEKGNSEITAEMVRDQCIFIDDSIPWKGRIPAICNTMKNLSECGGRVVGQDKDFNGFKIVFEGKANDLHTSHFRKNPKIESIKKDSSILSNNRIKRKQIENINFKISENFKVVMICASKKNKSFFTVYPEENFVNQAVNNLEHHPDDEIYETNISWRKYLENNQNDNNLLEAYKLYKRREYNCLKNKFKNNFYILSAGWGLINSEFKLPNYDITFSEQPMSRSKRNDNEIDSPIYRDFNQLNVVGYEDIIFVGSPAYIPLFIKLTQNLKNRKVIYWKSITPQPVPDRFQIPNDTFLYRFYNTNVNSCWYYQLAKDFYNDILP